MELLKGHDHNVERWRGICKCDACDDRSFNHGLECKYCEFKVHNKCTFVFSTLETFEHTSHVGHCLKLLTTGAPDHTDPKCHICGKNTQRLLYHCSICKLNLDIDCMIDDMCDRAHLNMPWHHHPLLKLDFGYQMLCKVCGHPDEYGYFCPRCKLMVHEKCASIFDSPVINHPFHARHSLKLLTKAPDYTDPKCHVCRRNTETFLYHCDICKFNLDMVCAIEYHDQHKPTPVALSNMKVHEHTLTLIPRLISFVCNGCGTEGDRSPYVSLQDEMGDLMFFHQECARLPRVINVNRHDHRVSYTYPLGPGEWKCGICLEKIDWSYGAYSCSVCPNYVLHSRCATTKDVWNGKDLDGVPEEIEDIEPFKMNEDNTITHFAHKQHKMSINKDVALVESILCEACVRPIASNSFYYCSDCSFILHETCANLPKKKRHFLSPEPLTLRPNRATFCKACLQICCKGFMYIDEGGSTYDLLCSSIAMPFIHESHPHPLLYLKKDHILDFKLCQSCGITNMTAVLGCIKCKYFLDFRCATLPLTARLHNYDAHPLTLCYGEKASGKYWCDICERETNPETWFYTCNDCGVTLHIFCVLGVVRYAKHGGKLGDIVELMFNNTSSRPLCKTCHCRCAAPFFVKKNIFSWETLFCSYYCLLRDRMEASDIASNIIRPPWYEPLALDW